MSSWHFLGSFFPPVLAPDYLLALLSPLFQTLEIAAAAMTIAFCVSLPLGICASLRLPGGFAILSFLALPRLLWETVWMDRCGALWRCCAPCRKWCGA
jgi:ABC-type phosphate/phosphonate transport system permease subunit